MTEVESVAPLERRWGVWVGRFALMLCALAAVHTLHQDTFVYLQRAGDEHGVVARSLRTAELLHNEPAFVATGSSQMREAFDAEVFIAEGLSAVSLGSSSKNPCRGLPEQHDIRATAPDVLVIGVSYFDLHDRNCGLLQPGLLGAAGGRLGPDLAGILPDEDADALRRGRELPWMATRPWIRDAILSRLLGKALPPRDAPPWRYAGRAPEPTSALVTRWREGREMFDVVDDGGPAYRALDATVRGAQGVGARVIVVAMPLHPGVSATERTPAAHESLRTALHTLSVDTGATLVDWEDRFEADMFYDITHLNERGRAAFSRELHALVTDVSEGAP